MPAGTSTAVRTIPATTSRRSHDRRYMRTVRTPGIHLSIPLDDCLVIWASAGPLSPLTPPRRPAPLQAHRSQRPTAEYEETQGRSLVGRQSPSPTPLPPHDADDSSSTAIESFISW